MIKYSLVCKNCDMSYDSWFASSKEFDKLKKKKLINCHGCGSLKVEKNLMAPKLISKTFKDKNDKKDLLKFQKIKKKINEYQKFIKNNFDYVGENFTYEARSIHYNEKKRNKGIYGLASKKDLNELKDEGIDAQLIPWVENENN